MRRASLVQAQPGQPAVLGVALSQQVAQAGESVLLSELHSLGLPANQRFQLGGQEQLVRLGLDL